MEAAIETEAAAAAQTEAGGGGVGDGGAGRGSVRRDGAHPRPRLPIKRHPDFFSGGLRWLIFPILLGSYEDITMSC